MRWLLCVLCVALWAGAFGAQAQQLPDSPKKPNVLVVIADDCTFSDLPLYGGVNLTTPNIDKLASQGMTFDRAYVSMAMCSPCRTEMYTGLYPQRSGVVFNHGKVKPGTTSFAQHMGGLGYRTGLAGKTHVGPKPSFPYEYVKGLDDNCVHPEARFDLSGATEFVSRDDDQPFMLVLALVLPHVVWESGDASQFDPKDFKLPPYLVDTPQLRKDFAKYLAEIKLLDDQVGAIMQMLKDTGHDQDTIVLFTSEQGAQFPGCKWTNYDTGIHTAMTVRWPGVVEAGKRTPAMVQYADVLPTFFDIAGGQAEPGQFDGTSFRDVLEGKTEAHRTFSYAMHNNVPEGPPYPIRSVSDGKFRYIQNLMPETLYIERHVMGVTDHNPYWSSWMRLSHDHPKSIELISRYMRRPAEELYDVEADPFQMHNIAGDPDYADVQAKLTKALNQWREDGNDPGAEQDRMEVFRANRDQ